MITLQNKMDRERKWLLKKPGESDAVRELQASLKIHPAICNLLVQRGIKDFEAARKFFRPSLDDLHNPFLMKDMDQAVRRIISGMNQGEKILVYGDYDVDGTTSVALMYSFLKQWGRQAIVNFYLPDRYKEGYGISMAGIDWARERDYTLIIALDCGIKSMTHVNYAKTLGIDFIICDHHLPGETIPSAVAVLDPKRSDCHYPYKELSGCGIGFKLASALASRLEIPDSQMEKYLDLVVVSIASDIVPITGENRILAHFGLKKLNESPRKGFKALLDLASVDKKLNITDVVFSIGPRINAAGRIEDAKKSVDLLISEETEEAINTGKMLNAMNAERKQLDAEITESALQLIREDATHPSRKTTVVYHKTWHKGVLGIVASRLTDHHYRPTIVMTETGDLFSGSARSVKGFDIHAALEKCKDLLEQFGGHQYAAGLSVRKSNLELFLQKFEEVVSDLIEDDMMVQEKVMDSIIQLSDLTPSFYKILDQLGPFGPGNMTPVFLCQNLKSKWAPRVVGANHLKFTAFQDGTGVFDAIAFQQAENQELVGPGRSFDLCFQLEENTWNGETTLQLNVKDIREAGRIIPYKEYCDKFSGKPGL